MNSVGKFWAQVPVYILRDHRHRAGHLRVLGAILSCPAPHFPSLNEIAARSGHKPKYCSNMISQMVSFGTLEREQRYNATNVYRLTGFSIDSTTDVDRDSTTDVDTDPTRVMELKESLKEDNIYSKGTSNGTPSFGASNGKKSSKGTSNGRTVVLKGFGYFCSLYPRHRLGSVRRLRDLWITCNLEDSKDVIIESLKSFTKSVEWAASDGKWVPGAYKFLDEERWQAYAVTPPNPLSIYDED